jgi:triacylglycerol lipase
LSCTRLNAPIVLAHGLFGFRHIGLGRFTLVSYFRKIPEFLRSGGNRVVVTRVPAIAGVRLRAEVLGSEIDAALPGQAFHFIGHSMGGLDARQLCTDPRWASRFLSLTTIGTPHLGSSLADRALARFGPVYRLLNATGVDHRGFLDVTRRAAGAVDRSCPRSPDFPCFSLAGVPVSADVCWPLRPFHAILNQLEGPNDGLVSSGSAQAFGAVLDPWPIDHLRQVNWMPAAPATEQRRSVVAMYAAIVENLVRLGFAATDPDPARRDSPPPWGSSEVGRLRRVCPALVLGWRRGRVEEDGNGHIAEHVRGSPAAVEKPVDGQEDGDLVGRQADGREDQR